MLSKARIKFIKSLQVKKYRQQEQCFTVEGAKSIIELLNSDFQTDLLVATAGFLARHEQILKRYQGEWLEVKVKELEPLGVFQSNDAAIAVARMKPNLPLTITRQEFALVLDNISDPGNLGTIIRIADWYGVQKIIASPETADHYNPKVIHASMGSFTRVTLYYTDVPDYLATVDRPVWGTFMEGEDVHHVDWGGSGLIIIGNEAHGISKDVEKRVTRRITIPKYGGAESLNAAAATAVICDNLKRSISN
jgi:RNA methyltransferase, TrmH family